MAGTAPNGKPIKDQVSPEEWQTRVDLAAFYRLVAKHGMDDLVGTHISARVPGHPDQFLLNPYGQLFNQITASSLVKVDVEGNTVLDSGYPVNAAGFTIHSAVLMGRSDVNSVAHTHTVPGMAISATDAGVLPLNQNAMRFYTKVGYHDYEGPATDLDERERLQRDLADKDVLVLRNHGLLVASPSVREAWTMLYGLEKVCKVQLMVQATGEALIVPSENLARHCHEQMQRSRANHKRTDGWESQLRLLDRDDPSYAH
jgi:ribulose-5-phosphate 4-epimerase/fuculose-1-phosphate aldolase